jgi:hypothetical protein
MGRGQRFRVPFSNLRFFKELLICCAVAVSRIDASDAGLFVHRELDDVLGLTPMAGEMLAEARTGQNGRHTLLGLGAADGNQQSGRGVCELTEI